MRFVAGADVRTLEFGRAYGEIVPRFLDSPLYRELITVG
jgi:8-oxo-dGTP diphosphatase